MARLPLEPVWERPVKTEGYVGWGVPPQEVLRNRLPGVPQTGNVGKGGTGGKAVIPVPCP